MSHEMIRGYLESGQTWQSRALSAEQRLGEAYARLRLQDEQLAAVRLAVEEEREACARWLEQRGRIDTTKEWLEHLAKEIRAGRVEMKRGKSA